MKKLLLGTVAVLALGLGSQAYAHCGACGMDDDHAGAVVDLKHAAEKHLGDKVEDATSTSATSLVGDTVTDKVQDVTDDAVEGVVEKAQDAIVEKAQDAVIDSVEEKAEDMAKDALEDSVKGKLGL